MQAADIMTRNVISVEADATILQAARLMLTKRISGLPVTDSSGRLVGMVTEGDFLRRGEIGTQRQRPRWIEFLKGPGSLATEYAKAWGGRVADVMTSNVYTISEDTPVDEIVRILEKHGIKRLPVVSEGRLVGIVSRANLLRAMASVARAIPASSADDATIRQTLMEELNRQSWAPVATIDPIVRDGVVDLWGTILDERQRQALRIVAERVPGVREVRDHLVWIEPMSGMALIEPEADTTPAKKQRR